MVQTFLYVEFQYGKNVVEYAVVVSSGGAEDDRVLDVASSLAAKLFLIESLFLFVVFGQFMHPDFLHVKQQVCHNLLYIACFVNKRLVENVFEIDLVDGTPSLEGMLLLDSKIDEAEDIF